MVNGAAREEARPWSGLNAGFVLAAFAMLGVGFFTFGLYAQLTDIIWGLWLTEAFAITLPAAVFLLISRTPTRALFGEKPASAKWVAVAVLSALLNQPIVSLCTWAAQRVLPAPWVASFDAKNAGLDAFFSLHPLPMFLAVVVAAPLGEETFFRGFALPAAMRSMRPLFAAVFVAALFSAMHCDAVGALGLFEIGFWLSVLRLGSGSLLVAMLGHALNNAFAALWFLLGLQTPSRAQPAWAVQLGLDNPDVPPNWLLVLGGLLLVLGVWLSLRTLSGRRGAAPGAQGESLAPKRAWPLIAFWCLAVFAGVAGLGGAFKGRP